MVDANYNLKDLLIEKLDVLVEGNNQISNEFNISTYILKNISDLLSKVLNKDTLIDHNISSQNNNILNCINEIRVIIFHMKNNTFINSINFFDESELSSLRTQFLEVISSSNDILNKLKNFNNQLNEKIQENSLLKVDNEIHISNDFIKLIKHIPNFQYELLSILKYILNILENSRSQINSLNNNLSLKNINNIQEDIPLLIKKYNNEISNLTNKFEKDFKKIELDYENLMKSSELLNEGVDSGLKNLAELNTKIQKVEL